MKATIFHKNEHFNIIIIASEPDITPEKHKENFKHIYNNSVLEKTTKLLTPYPIHSFIRTSITMSYVYKMAQLRANKSTILQSYLQGVRKKCIHTLNNSKPGVYYYLLNF